MSLLEQESIRPVGAGLLGRVHLRGALVVATLLALGVTFSILNVNLVRSAEAAITVAEIGVPVPTSDPFAEIWNRSPVAAVPLSAQQIWQPGGGSVTGVEVQALQDGQRIAFRVSWADSTVNNEVTGDNPSDAVAIQLPLDPLHLPYQCMGQPSSAVNIWQWRAALEDTAKASEGAIPYNGTRNLMSYGLGKAADQPGVHPVANSVHRDGRWYVIFSRELAASSEGTAPLTAGLATNAAFAVWDGDKGETRSMKAVSTWTPLTVQSAGKGVLGNYLFMVVAAIVSVAAIVLGFRFLPR